MTPKELGYRMPAEWEKHESTWLAWPKDPDTFPKGIIKQVEQTYVKIIGFLARGEKVNLLVDDKKTEEYIRPMLPNKKNIAFHQIKTADVWIRDYGPIFIKCDKDTAATKWIFNSWGNKYEELLQDNDAGRKIIDSIKMNVFEPNIVLEGGSIDTNGLGFCITTGQCLLNKNRNPNFSKEQIESCLQENLGFTNMIWLNKGIVGDDTDGHIDDIARFVSKDTIVCAVENNKEDENYGILKENFEILEKSNDDNKLNIIPIPMPRKIISGVRRLPASYLNFYIGNSAVLVPAFDEENDEKVISIFTKLFPGRKVIGIDCKGLVYGYGGIHCITQQQPL
jgi:agmatine deiminase